MNINAIIANTGNGSITTGNISTGDIDQSNEIVNANKDEFVKILNELQKLVEDLGDSYSQKTVELIQDETKSPTWNKKVIEFMLDSLQETGVTLAAKGLVSIVSKAITLLPLI